mgnify:CR=1
MVVKAQCIRDMLKQSTSYKHGCHKGKGKKYRNKIALALLQSSIRLSHIPFNRHKLLIL